MTVINLPAREDSSAPEAEVLPPEESTLVSQFIDRSQTIIPGLQVTLAKRVVMPGSRRVLCMAAHTSVPISDNELSSVSELALRLSDGTSCLLSLKFFNDTIDSGFTNTNPFIYDPQRYETVHGQSDLGVAILAVAFVAITGYYYAISQSMMANMHGSSTAVFHKSASHPAFVNTKVAPISTATPKNLVPEAKSAPVKTTTAKATVAKSTATKSSISHRSSSHVRANNNEYAEPSRSSPFVPPPPPMMVSPMPYNPAMSYPFYMPNNVQPLVKKTVTAAKPKAIEQPAPKPIETVAPKAIEQKAQQIESAAPAPGEAMQLERIVIPNQ
jgi:hypothetical protein